jgi:plasmid stabilization system protein ParE
MRVVYTKQAIDSLNEAISLLKNKASRIQIETIVNRIFDRCEKLTHNPLSGQIEEYLQHLNLNHRRIVSGNYKIIYRIKGKTIYITDIFDTRQSPLKMKG